MLSTRTPSPGRWRRPACRSLWAVGALLIACVAALVTPPARADTGSGTPPVQSIGVDSRGTGRVFDGIGAISGGGGTSRLLVDYPKRQRDQILDYLFKPGYGASLQILKVEIGSDTNSSNGAEPSHMRTPTGVNCDRGYEWWLMEQAQRRNPRIQFYGLEWGAPGWFDGGFWSTDNVNYLMQWLGCAKKHHLDVNYLGGWNEKGWDAAWYGKLKAALVKNGYADVKVVAADNAGWQVATDMKNDQAFARAVDVVGIHYPCSEIHCSSSPDALGLDKPLFASESGWNNYLTGAPRLAAEMNHEYVDSRITGFINWPMAYAWYPTVQMQGSGLLRANEPWSGHYELGPTLWTIAQTAQFTRPGWRYIDSASGYLDGGGTYVTLQSPGKRPAYTTVFETTAATARQTVAVTPAGHLPGGALHRWSTTLRSTDPADWFVRGADVHPGARGSHTVTLQPGTVTTLTTMPGGKGAAVQTSPPSRTMALPYRDTFDGYRDGVTPRYLSDMEGAFETAPCSAAPEAAPGSGGTGRCLRQAVTTQPIKWSRVPSPLTLAGDNQWTDYTVSAKVMIRRSGTASLLGRVVNQLNSAGPDHDNVWEGYYLKLSDAGTWSLEAVMPDKTTRILAHGDLPSAVPSAGTDTWHRFALGFSGERITATVDGTQVAEVTDTTYDHGQVGLGLGSYGSSQFDDLAVAPEASRQGGS